MKKQRLEVIDNKHYTKHLIERENRVCAKTYNTIPIVLERSQGVYVWDIDGNQYIDCMSAYSAVSLGHGHPRIIKAIEDQINTLGVVSRVYYTKNLAPFLERACELTGLDMAIPKNGGVEAVEAGVKAARRWAYQVKKVPEDQAEIIVCNNNFHGRTTTVISFSTEKQYQKDFGPLTPGFKAIPFGDAQALANAITDNTAAFLVEPIQGESGINMPPDGYLAECAQICRDNNVLLLCDEIQTGLGRTGKFLASMHDDVIPDGVMLGKALGGGLLPVSMFLARREILELFDPGSDGSTFGGNELSSRVGLEVLNTLVDEKLVERSAKLGAYFLAELQKINSPKIKNVRGKGLFIGLEVDTSKADAHDMCEQMINHGVLTKDTHGTVLRLVPPLIISKDEIDIIVDTVKQVFKAK